MTEQPEFILYPYGGLCNRLRAIESALVLSEDTNSRLTVLWEISNDLACPFERLFEPYPSPTTVISFSRKSVSRLRFWYLQISGNPFLHSCLDYFKKRHFDFFLQKNFGTTPIQLPPLDQIRNSRRTFISSYERFYGGSRATRFKLKPTPEIQKTIDNQISQLGISPVGIHIRRTDHHLQHLSPLGAFVSAMEVEIEKNPATKFFLATDCHQTKSSLVASFPGHITTQEISLERNSISGIESAVVDLFCLASCNKIIGSAGSSFSDTAGTIGDIPVNNVAAANSPTS